MSSSEFLTQFFIIENHLFKITPAFDRKKGFFNLLNYLQLNNLITNDLLINIYDIFQLRNKIMNSLSGEIILTIEIINKIQKIKQNLNI